MSRRLAVAVLLTGTLALAACGGDEPSTGADAPSSAAAANALSYEGVTVNNPTDLDSAPQGTSSSTATPAELEFKDLVEGTGDEATPTSNVQVHYQGFLYADGKQFDSSWDRGEPIEFPLTGVVPGFTQGIGGTDDVPAMKVGGRRIMILPAELGYGASGTPDGSIPPNTPIVFVVDLLAVS